MSPLNKGHALWQPAPLPYFERVQLGDVGYIREGCFNLLFSARCPPSPLKKLNIGRILQPQPQIPGCLTGNQEATVITKPSSGTPVSALEPGSSIQLQFKERRGAALVTKYQTYKENIQAVGTFNKYVKENYASWVEFAREEGHGDVNPVLVTGLDRTKDFAMMCYSNHDNGLECEFKTSTSEVASGSAWGTWQTTKFIHMNHGPQLCSPPSSANAEGLTPPGDHRAETASDEYNQCVFVRYFTMRTRLGIPKVIKAGAGPHDPGTGWEHDDEGLLPEVHSGLGWDSDSDSDSESDMSSLLDGDGDDDGGSVTSIETESDIVIHNPTSDNKDDFDVIADYIFQNSDAESVLLHHRDITPLREPGSNLDLMTQLLEKRPQIMVDENGVGIIEPQTELAAEPSPDVPAQSSQTTQNLETEGYGSRFLPWLAPPQKEIAAETSPNVPAQSRQITDSLETGGYGSRFLPWLALIFQIPFAAGYPFEDVLNFFMVVGSPALAAYSLLITHLNAIWIKKATSNLKYPNSRAIAAVISTFQHIPIRVSWDEGLPHGDSYWELLQGITKTGGWSIPLVVGFVCVVFTALLEIINSFYYPPSEGIGCSTVTIWTFLLPLVVGFLHVGFKPRPDHLRKCLENANMIARVVTDHGDRPVRASDTTAPMIQAVEAGLPRMDELRITPIFNYARAFIWFQHANQVLSSVRAASASRGLQIPPDGDDPGEGVSGGYLFYYQQISPLPSTRRSTDNNWSVRQSRWAPGIWRVGLAMVFALGLQWGTIGAAMVVNYRMPPVGLDSRTLSFLVYGATATLSMLLCVASSILAHISRSQSDPVSRPPWFQACLNGGAAVCGYFGKALAFITGIWVVICFFQSSGCTSIIPVLLRFLMEGFMAWCCLGSILYFFFCTRA